MSRNCPCGWVGRVVTSRLFRSGYHNPAAPVIDGLSLGRETLRRPLRSAGLGSPRKRRTRTHRLRRLARAREGEMLLLDASLYAWLENRGPQFTLLGFLDDATRQVLAAEFFPTEDARGCFRLLRRLLCRYGVPLSLYGDRGSIFVRNDDHWSLQEQLAGKRRPIQFGRALRQLGVTYIAANSPRAKGRIERPWGTFQDRLTSELRLAGPAHLPSANAALRRFLADYHRRFARTQRQAETAWRPRSAGTAIASAASCTNAASATTISCNGTVIASKSRPSPNASASPGPRFRFTKPRGG